MEDKSLPSQITRTLSEHKFWTVVAVMLVLAVVQLVVFGLFVGGDSGVDVGPRTTTP